MKKVLAMALGAMLVTGSAAGAASHIDFVGYYRVNYMVDRNMGYYSDDKSFTDSYFDDRLLIETTFSPTDEIAVHWQFRGLNRTRWGGGGRSLSTQFAYGEVKRDWGTFYVGRIEDGLDAYGLASLGYQPGFGPFVNSGPFDCSDTIDGIRYNNVWDNGFGLTVQYIKMESGDMYNLAGDAYNLASDEDSDRYQAEVTYRWDGGGGALGLIYDRVAGGLATYEGRNFDKARVVFLNPAIMHSWGNSSVHFEGMAGWGTTDYYSSTVADGHRSKSVNSDGYGAYLDFDYNYGPGNVNLASWWVSGSSLGEGKSNSLVDLVGGNFFPLLVAYSGTGNGGNKYRSGRSYSVNAMGIANNGYENFIAPTIGATGATLLNGSGTLADYKLDLGVTDDITGVTTGGQLQTFSRTRFTSFNESADANHWAVALSGNHALNDDITIHYALAYLALNNPNYRVVNSVTYGTDVTTMADASVSYQTQKKDLGFEADLGFQFRLLDNLRFTTNFGYMFTGDAYKTLRGYEKTVGDANAAPVANDVVKAKWNTSKDSYVWYNTLQFDF